MKYLFIYPNNIAPYQVKRINSLVDIGADISVLCLTTPQHGRPWNEENFAKALNDIHNLPNATHFSIYKKIKELNPKKIYICGYIPVMLKAAHVAKVLGIPVNIFIDIYQPLQSNRLKELCKKYWLKVFTKLAIVPGIRQKKYALQLGIKEKNIFIVPFAVSYQDYQQSDLKNDKDKYLLSVSRLSPEKSILTLIRAYKAYVAKGGKRKLLIAGEGPQRQEIEKYIVSNNLSHAVKLLGWQSQPELKAIYSGAYAFILNSKYEPWGVVVNEAIASGLPLILSSHIGAINQIAFHNENALLLTDESTETLTNTLNLLDEDIELHRHLAKNSIKIATENDLKVSAQKLYKTL